MFYVNLQKYIIPTIIHSIFKRILSCSPIYLSLPRTPSVSSKP
ncbi:hypothetical protein [Moraxella lacunata]